MDNIKFTCASCTKQGCAAIDFDNMPTNCPSLQDEERSITKELFTQQPDKMFAYESAVSSMCATEARTRLEDTVDFIRRCGYKSIGLAFCKMVKNDAALVERVLRSEGFTVNSVMCRMGALSNELLEREGENTIGERGYVSMCNPIGQALMLNKQGTEFNIVLGLCVGHDTMFFRHSEAPFTVLGVKDKKNGCSKVEYRG